MSPYTDIWRWHVTMAASILFRATIIAATVGAVILAVWLGALAFGPEHFDCLSGLAGSPLGLFVFFGLTVVAFSFVLNGARHLINDSGHGLTLKPANLLANIAVWAPVPLAIVFWVILFATGRVSL
ncbi:succinate dehydrogenase, cytochrome b556 subunit [Pseudomonas sp. ODNR1LW]|nr:succinate dehydrogenase, cytochrome b556 subunit [Pseudomonas sp. ODNR1LW]